MKLIVKEDACMKFYNETMELSLETDASGKGLGPGPLQTREGTSCQKDGTYNKSILRTIAFYKYECHLQEKDTVT